VLLRVLLDLVQGQLLVYACLLAGSTCAVQWVTQTMPPLRLLLLLYLEQEVTQLLLRWLCSCNNDPAPVLAMRAAAAVLCLLLLPLSRRWARRSCAA
jgi:hypothetical protein